ncbi:MAG TPA: hypothetical protein VMF29_06575, partial [Candidatus Edwardsbacteria bacterium]|nr:hypothetical protein [Candidatus Edwardsbacteria bacterium]
MMSRKITPVVAIFALGFASFASAQAPVDENALFADSASVTQAPLRADSALLKNPGQSKSTGISGTVTSAALGSCDRDFFSDRTYRHTALATWITGDLNLDARLAGGFKAFASVEATYRPIATETAAGNDSNIAFSLPELFVDANYRNRVYVRSGKQVLQWGRCYFWNPTDLINIEQKQF